VQVRIHEGMTGAPPPEPLILRLVIRRKDPDQAEAEQKRLLKDARSAPQPDPRSLERRSTFFSLPRCRPPPSRRPTSSPSIAFAGKLAAFKRFKSLAASTAAGQEA